MRIPITMCHGVRSDGKLPLPVEHFDRLIRVASELGFESVDYNDLAAWREGTGTLPRRPILLDFDHAVKSMRNEVHTVLSRYGYRGNLFIHTGPLKQMYSGPLPPEEKREWMTWEEIGELMAAGWHIGSHTVTHPNLSKLCLEDPSGAKIRAELEGCDETLKKHLGITPKDFAFTGTSWSSMAEREVMKRYRFGRLWIVGSRYQADGKDVRYAELAGVTGPDEPDGGPPMDARYITEESNPYRLPSMEFQGLIHEPEAFRGYLLKSASPKGAADFRARVGPASPPNPGG
ncbi:MAG: polysaccharide deacetylase family protein [Planctomycetes bacterium]|nr:polysaccharide deacetylase family protein [Planctomycetota bacterium]